MALRVYPQETQFRFHVLGSLCSNDIQYAPHYHKETGKAHLSRQSRYQTTNPTISLQQSLNLSILPPTFSRINLSCNGNVEGFEGEDRRVQAHAQGVSVVRVGGEAGGRQDAVHARQQCRPLRHQATGSFNPQTLLSHSFLVWEWAFSFFAGERAGWVADDDPGLSSPLGVRIWCASGACG